MITRMRKALAEDKDQGFTLIELLVVIIIIGILAAIAIPLFLNQRRKAVDSAARSDVSTIGKEVATWFVDNVDAPTVGEDATAGQYTIGDGTDSDPIGRISNNISLGGGPDATDTSMDWCVFVEIEEDMGTLETVEYSSADGLVDDGDCS